MTTKTDITLPLLPEATIPGLAVRGHGGIPRYLFTGDQMQAYARAAVEADRQRRMPSAAEISSVIREITGHPDIKSGHASLVVKLSFLFARYGQPAASAEPRPDEIRNERLSSATTFGFDEHRVIGQPAASAEVAHGLL